MADNSKKTVLLLAVVSALFFSGCTSWKKKYQALDVEHQNLKGLLDRERAERGHLVEQISRDSQTIDQLQEQIQQRNQSPAEASGFGDGYDVAFDASAGTITVTLQNKILFAPGKASFKKANSTELDHIFSVLQSKYPGRPIDVIGHTDSDPITKSKWKDNWELSSQRALTVTRYLLDRGLAKEKVRPVGCGASRPVASNATDSGKARNRRVEIVVHMR